MFYLNLSIKEETNLCPDGEITIPYMGNFNSQCGENHKPRGGNLNIPNHQYNFQPGVPPVFVVLPSSQSTKEQCRTLCLVYSTSCFGKSIKPVKKK